MSNYSKNCLYIGRSEYAQKGTATLTQQFIAREKAAYRHLAYVLGFALLPSLPGMRRGSHGRGAAEGS